MEAAIETTNEELPVNADEFQRQSRRTWTIEPHIDLTRGWNLLGDIDRAVDVLDGTLDEHKRALFYGDDEADVLRATGDGDYMLEQVGEQDWSLLHASLGAATEAGEILEEARNLLSSGDEPDLEHVAEEVGDLMYYLARLADVCDTSLLEIMRENNQKLRERFPDSFAQDDALNRDTESEKEAMQDPLESFAREGLRQGWGVASIDIDKNGDVQDAELMNDARPASGDWLKTFYDMPWAERASIVNAIVDYQQIPE